MIDDTVFIYLFCAVVYRFGKLFGRGAAIGGIELDAEVALGAAGVVAGREDDAALGGVFADHGRGGWGGEQAVAADQHATDAVGCRHADDGLDCLAVVIAAVTADHQGAALEIGHHIEDGLDKVLQVVGGLELGNGLAQP